MGPGRAEIAKRIEASRSEGDLSENGGYHAAKEEQGKQEARIRQLQHLLQRAKVGETPPDDGVVEPGMIVEIRLPATTTPSGSCSVPVSCLPWTILSTSRSTRRSRHSVQPSTANAPATRRRT